ncbi:MAG: class I SAM-dependent methyltransferase [Deltaproteobacteria bacterium]|nr:class I SAM-dependent methyltransferase [Deltaproteobacteria bacterium]
MPLVGQLLAGTRQAYTHLPESIRMFPLPDELKTILEQHRVTPRGLLAALDPTGSRSYPIATKAAPHCRGPQPSAQDHRSQQGGGFSHARKGFPQDS